MLRVLITFITFLSLSLAYAATPNCQTHQCIAVVDAGSTGSRLHVFSFDYDDTKTPINIEDFSLNKTSPGFATLDANQETVNQYLKKLFSTSEVNNIPVYFYATAGMRLLAPAKQKQLYSLLTNWFNNQSTWQLTSAKTITGKDEAIYDWFAVNYLSGRLNDIEKLHLAGVIDVGGASTQITFPITNSMNASPADLEEIDFRGHHIQLFAHSFLGLGTTELINQLLDESSCFTNGYPLPSAVGQTNAAACNLVLVNLVNKVHHVSLTVRSTLKSNLVTDWYSLGAAGYLPQTKPLEFANNEFTLGDLKEQGQSRICSENWDDLSKQYSEPYLYQACLTSMYYPVLFSQGYGIDLNQTFHFFPEKQMPDWTLGVVLHH